MPITQQPQYNPASCYQPVVYKCERSATLPESVAYVQYIIGIDGIPIALDTKSPDNDVDNGGGNFTYQFEIDIQSFLQRFLAPNRDKSSMFGTLDDLSVVTNTDAFQEVVVSVSYAIKNEFGIVQDPTFSELSGANNVTIAKRQNGEPRSLNQFLTPQIKFLTKRPRFITSEGCPSFLSFYNDQPTLNGFRLTAFDSTGAVLSTNYSDFGTYQSTEQMTVGVGYSNIDNSLSSNWLNGDDKPDLSAAASYTIDFGAITTDINGAVLSYTQLTEQALYEIDTICGKKLKLLWLNDLGGVDDYALPFVNLAAVIASDSFEKPLAWDAGSATPHAQYDYGRLRNNITAQRKYRIETRVAPNIAEWLRELLTSAEIYLINPEDSSELWRVFPDPNTYTERVGFGLVPVSFDLNLSQDYVVHRV